MPPYPPRSQHVAFPCPFSVCEDAAICEADALYSCGDLMLEFDAASNG